MQAIQSAYKHRAHPRSRGENHDVNLDEIRSDGSSPLTRGKPSRRVALPVTVGLIPAHAGKTMQAIQSAYKHRAHPRSRGENHDVNLDEIRSDGSSPLTRGKPSRRVALPVTVGLIPAHAGKTP